MVLAKSPPTLMSEKVEPEDAAGGNGGMATGARPKQKEAERCEAEDGNHGVSMKDTGLRGPWRGEDDHFGGGIHRRQSRDEYEVRLLTKVVAYQGLLQQFSHPQVRADLINNRFGDSKISFTLEALDILRCSVFPQWTGGSLEGSSGSDSTAAVHLINLMADSEEIVPHRPEDASPRTYAEWNRTLRMLAQSSYWNETKPEKRCTHIMKDLKPSFEDFKFPTMNPRVIGTKKEQHHEREKRDAGIEKIEEIVLSSDSSVDSSSSVSSSPDTSSSDGRVAMPRKLKKKVDKREIVIPPVFQMDGKLHLKSFLSSYESYFRSKFRGNSRDKCQQLEQFLTGDLLNVYKICGGRRLKYDQMKERLLTHFKKQKIGGRAYWRRKFEEASPKPEETLDLFGMRLMELAELAFPKSPREAAKMLRQTFLSQIPQKIREKISDMEKVMKATSGGSQKHLNFSAIMQLAADLQAELLRSHTIMWSDDLQQHVAGRRDTNNNIDLEPPHRRQFWSQGRFRHKTPERGGHEAGNKWQRDSPDHWQPGQSRYQKQWRSPDMRHTAQQGPSSGQWTPERPRKQDSSASRVKFCSYCGKRNHRESSCWRAKNACLICGGEHMMKDCPRYNPKFSRNGADSSN